MRRFFTLKLWYVLLLLTGSMSAAQLQAQTTVFQDDFNRASLSPGGTPSMTYTFTSPTNPTAITAGTGTNFLRIGSGATAPVNGIAFVSGSNASFGSPYNTALASNSGVVTWTFNFRWNRPASNNPAPPNSGAYGTVIVLAGSNSALNSGTGYAVVFGSSGTPDPIRLVSYSNGVTSAGSGFTDICTSGVNDLAATNNFVSVKVTYDPSGNKWSLYVRDDGASAWADPTTVAAVSQKGVTTANNTYTGTALNNFGFVWTFATGTNLSSDFDNYKVTVASAVVPATPTVSFVSPTSATAGSGNLLLTVNGTNFVSGASAVTFNGATKSTSFISATQLSAVIPAADLASTGVFPVGVVTTGALSPSNTVNFTVNPAATPSVTLTSPLGAFGNVCANSSTVTNSFTLSGSNLDGTDLVFSALPGITYSETVNGTYTNTLNLTYTGGGFTNRTVFVKFTPTAAQSYDGTINITGGGSATVPVSVSATGVIVAPTVTTGSNIVAGTSASLFGTIANVGCGTITNYGFEYSTTSGFANGTGLQVTAVNLNSGSFSKTLSGLTGATAYYYKAFATNASGTAYGAENSFATSSTVPVVMSAQPLLRYTENFSDINNWTNNFASGIGANHFGSVVVSGSAAIPNATRTTTSTATFSNSSSGGVQKGTGALMLLATGSTDNSSSAAVDFYMDFTGVNAGTLSFDWASVNNGTGDRKSSLRVYASTDGINYTELTSADVLNFTNNVPSQGTVSSVALPASFSNSATARLRFYYHNGTGGASGSRPKISIDNLIVTAVASAPCATPANGPTALIFPSVTETSVQGSFTAAASSPNEYIVVMSTNSSLTSGPIDGQTYEIGDNLGDGTVIDKGNDLNFTATGLTGATTYYFFIYSVNSVCTGGPKYQTTDFLTDDVTTVAGLPNCMAPAAQATNLVLSAGINSVQGSFTATAADEYVVLQATSATLSGALSNGVIYNAGNTIGNATVIQRSNATTFTASGLNPQTQYYYFVFAVNSQGCLNGPVYNTISPLSGSATTQPLPVCVTPSAQPGSLSFNASNNSVTATFNAAGTGYNYLVVMSTSPSLGATPVDNTDYATGAALGGGTVISNNQSTSFIANNLSSATTYYFFIFSANKNCTGGTKYLATSPLTGSATTTNAPVYNYYFGNLHAHSDYSDGNKDNPGFTPANDYAYASASLGMDFLGISEHNHFSSLNNPGNELANYHLGVQQAATFNASHPNFLALYGMEWGVISGGGHVVVYGDGLTDLFGWESNVNGNVGPNYDVYVPKNTYLGVEGLFQKVNDYVAKNAFATLAHPNTDDYNNLSNIAYDSSADAAITGVAVESGPATSANTTYSNPSTMSFLWYFQKLLAKGYHLGPTIDHDNHNTTFGRTTPARLAVLAPALTQSDIIKAVRDMHFYATEDIDARVDFTINTRVMGSIFEDRNAPSISVNLTDPSTSTSNALIRVMFGIPGSGINATVVDSVFGNSLGYVHNDLANHQTGYYYIDITNNGKRIITSPIWYTRTCASASDTTATVCGSFNWYGTVYTSSATATKVFTTAGGCDSTVTLHLTVNSAPASASIALAGSADGCPGTGVALTATAAGTIASYQWLKDGNIVATTADGNYTAMETGSYSVKAINLSNCSVVSANAVSVTVSDNIAPVPDAVTLPTITGQCSAMVTTIPTATDNCSGTITATTPDPLTYSTQGSYLVHWTYTDNAGNTSYQNQLVVVKDNIAPVPNVTELPAITAQCSVTVNAQQTPAPPPPPADPAPAPAEGPAPQPAAPPAPAPAAAAPAAPAFASFASFFSFAVTTPATATVEAPTATDNCGGTITATTSDPLNYTTQGTYIIHWTYDDGHGNISTQQQTIVVQDNTAPLITVPDDIETGNDAGKCGAAVAIATATATDDCGVAGIYAVRSDGLSLGDDYPVGTTTITWTATDAHGNQATATQTVTVTDNEKPTIIAPGQYGVVNDPGKCGATIANIGVPAPVVADNCGVASVTNNHPSADYPVGTTVVTWTVTDVHGNKATATQNITVMDNEVPTISVNNVNVNTGVGQCGATVILAAPITSDNCGVASVTNDHPSAFFPVGTTSVIWTVTDNSGWTSTATQSVTVTDAQAPTVITQNVTVYLDASGNATVTASHVNNGSIDNCGISSYALSKTSFTCADLGANTVSLTVTDVNGNSASANATVTVVDNTAPAVVTQPVTVYLNASGIATVTAAQVNNGSSDNCGISSYTLSKSSFNCANLGANTVTLTVTDASGNANSATAVITVKDNTAPIAIAQPVTVYLDASGNATVTASQVNNGSTDNCGISSYTLSKTSFNCANIGANNVTLTVTDAGGNSANAAAVVTVKDTMAPAVTAVPNQSFCATGGSYAIPALVATDNCSGVVVTYTITGATTRSGSGNNASGTFNTGISTINWTVKDASGNTTTSNTTVNISALPVATITVSNADAFCNKVTLTASAGAAYKWMSGSSTLATTQQLQLGQSNGDGVYQLYVTVGACTSAPASYNFQKQTIVSSYTILAFDKIDLGMNNIVASGSVGVTAASGEADFGSNSTVSSPGSFVKAKQIVKSGTNIVITNPIYSAAIGITLPTMLLNTASTNGLPNKEVAQNSISTVSGNYKNLTLKKGSRTVLTGNTFGNIRVEQGAQVTFTAGVINIEALQVVKGPRNGYSYIRFASDAKILVSKSVSIGSQVYINPDNNNVTFYMGDTKSDEEQFTVNGGDTKVTANVYLPNGKLKITGGYRYGDYGNGYGDCDRDDDEDKYYGQGTAYVNMTGLFIAQKVEGNGKNVIWNSFDCSSAPVPVTNAVITQLTNAGKEPVTTTTAEEDLKVTVMPNPSTSFFTLKIESRYNTPVSLRVMDSRGRVVDARAKLGANSTIEIGRGYSSGTYYAEMIQGGIRKTVQLIKARG